MAEDELQKRINWLIEQLGSDGWKPAFEQLTEIGKPAVSALIEAWKDRNDDVSNRVSWALRNILKTHPEYDWKDVIPMLVKLLKYEKEIVQPTAASFLRAIAHEHPWQDEGGAVPALIEALKCEHWLARLCAAEALYENAETHPEYDWKDAVPALIEALKDENEKVREEAAKVLGRIGEPAFEALVEAYTNGKIHFELVEIFYEELNRKTQYGFDKGCIALPRKKPKDQDGLKHQLLQSLARKSALKAKSSIRKRAKARTP